MTVEDELENIQTEVTKAALAVEELRDARATENIKSERLDKAIDTISTSLANIAFALRDIHLLKNLNLS